MRCFDERLDVSYTHKHGTRTRSKNSVVAPPPRRLPFLPRGGKYKFIYKVREERILVHSKVGRSLRAAAVVRRWPTATTRPEAKEWIYFPTTTTTRLLSNSGLRFGKISHNLMTAYWLMLELRSNHGTIDRLPRHPKRNDSVLFDNGTLSSEQGGATGGGV